jgi:hypothetical protein
LAAALEVVKAAAGTTPNEGSDEFDQIRLADTYLNADGGGGGYGEGIYFIAQARARCGKGPAGGGGATEFAARSGAPF